MDNTIFTVLKLLGSLALLMYGMTATTVMTVNFINTELLTSTQGMHKLFGEFVFGFAFMFLGLTTLRKNTKHINPEHEINNYRNLLKQHNVEDITNKNYQYQDRIYYMDIISEAEKLSDYVLKLFKQLSRRKYSMYTFILIGYLST